MCQKINTVDADAAEQQGDSNFIYSSTISNISFLPKDQYWIFTWKCRRRCKHIKNMYLAFLVETFLGMLMDYIGFWLMKKHKIQSIQVCKEWYKYDMRNITLFVTVMWHLGLFQTVIRESPIFYILAWIIA